MFPLSHKKSRRAFTMIELVFVIVIMGIIGKFGVEFLAQAYKSYIYTTVNTKLEAQSEVAIEFIAARLQDRIKDSVIVRKESDPSQYELISSATGDEYTILEWDANDIDGFRSEANNSKWSGILDLDACDKTTLKSPETNATDEDDMIQALSDSSFSDAAIYFIGSNANKDSWGWQDGAINDQNQSLHPIKKGSNDDEFESDTASDFSNVDLYEYYKLIWTANAIDLNTTTHKLTFYYDYQPWQDETYADDAKSALIMENVSTFRFMAVGSTIKIQVCVKSDIIDGTDDAGGYSICKEKTIF